MTASRSRSAQDPVRPGEAAREPRPSSTVADALATIATGFDELARAVAQHAPARRWLALEDAATYVCSTPRALADARRRGALAAVRQGRGYVYDRAVLDAWMLRDQTPAKSPPVTSLREHLRAQGRR